MREIRPDLSRKIYFTCCPVGINCIPLRPFTRASTPFRLFLPIDADPLRWARHREYESLIMSRKKTVSWIIKIILISVMASMVFMLISTEVLGYAGFIISFALLAVFILIGVTFDIIAIAVTVATETPFHSMAARRERGATESLKLVRNANRVNSLCSDVVGDVTGIVSGTTAALITARVMTNFNTEFILFELLIIGIVTGLTIGGKAVGKIVAIRNSTSIVHRVGIFISFLKIKRKR